MYASLRFGFIVSFLFVADFRSASGYNVENGTAPKPQTGSPAKPRTTGDISKQKCKEYAQYTLECDYYNESLLIGGDTRAREREFPHMALLGFQSENEVQWQCGGSLISENFVLTAAHCLNNRRVGPPKFVRVGLTNQLDTKNMQESTVSEVIVYPEFNNTAYHDIGLLKLSKKLDLNVYVRPACLQTERTIRASKVLSSGWSRTEAADTELLDLILEISDAEKCNMAYRSGSNPRSKLKDGILDDLMICAGSNQNDKDSCQVTSGGPIQLYHDNGDIKCMYDIVGVTSFGPSCGLAKNIPNVHTRVSAYLKWIEDTVWPQ